MTTRRWTNAQLPLVHQKGGFARQWLWTFALQTVDRR